MTENNQLSDRELEILKLVATGASNKEIARELAISINTVKVHLRNIFGKLEVASRTEATMWAVRMGVVTPEIESVDDPEQNGTEEETPLRWGKWLFWFSVGAVILVLAVIFGVWLARQGNPGNEVIPEQSTETETQRWRELASLPTPRSRFASAEYENQIYAIGGQTEDGITNSVERYDVESDLWVKLSSKKVPVVDISAAVIGGNIFVPGGQDESGEVINIVEVYDPYADQWDTVAPLPKALSAYALVAYEGRLFVFGGWDGQHYLNTVYMYDPVLNQWSERTPMPTARAYAGAAVVQGKIFVVGGENDGTKLSINEEYWPEIDNGVESPWTSRANIPEPCSRMGVANVAEILHLVGGGRNNYRYYPQEDSWNPFPVIHGNIWEDLGVVPSGSNLIAFGGQQGSNLVDTNVSYQAIYIVSIPVMK